MKSALPDSLSAFLSRGKAPYAIYMPGARLIAASHWKRPYFESQRGESSMKSSMQAGPGHCPCPAYFCSAGHLPSSSFHMLGVEHGQFSYNPFETTNGGRARYRLFWPLRSPAMHQERLDLRHFTKATSLEVPLHGTNALNSVSHQLALPSKRLTQHTLSRHLVRLRLGNPVHG